MIKGHPNKEISRRLCERFLAAGKESFEALILAASLAVPGRMPTHIQIEAAVNALKDRHPQQEKCTLQ